MRNRLKEYMLSKSLNAAEFADRIGVQRSNISHILNGRNNPGAQFLEKLLVAFPDLDADWLITGRGEMLKNKETFPDTRDQRQNIGGETGKSETESGANLMECPGTSREANHKKTSKDAEKIIFFFPDHTFLTYYPNK